MRFDEFQYLVEYQTFMISNTKLKINTNKNTEKEK